VQYPQILVLMIPINTNACWILWTMIYGGKYSQLYTVQLNFPKECINQFFPPWPVMIPS